MSRRVSPPPRLILERERRQCMDPMGAYAERHEHLLIGSLCVRVTKTPPAEPAAPAPEPEAPAAPQVTEADQAEHTRHMARVFAPDTIAEARELLGATSGKADNRRDAATLACNSAALQRAAHDDGWRSVPWAGPDAVEDPFGCLGPEFANFGEVLEHLRTQWTLVRRASSSADARIDPILLTGEPGVGKTYFAAALAELIRVRMSVFSARGAQDGMQLCGSDARWSGSRSGMVLDVLSLHDSAAPVLLVDELDKLAPNSGAYRDTPTNTLLDLLEEDSVRRYRDMSLQLEMDASRIIVVCSVNERERISPPLLSNSPSFTSPGPPRNSGD